MATIHELKANWIFYERVNAEEKKAELRLNDRDYHQFDYLRLVRYQPGSPISHTSFYLITDVLRDYDYPQGLQPGYVMLSLQRCTQGECDILFGLPVKPPPAKPVNPKSEGES